MKTVLDVFIVGASAEELVQNVVVSFARGVESETDFFEEVGLDFGALEDSGAVESQFDEFTKTGGVVIAEGFGISCRRLVVHSSWRSCGIVNVP